MQRIPGAAPHTGSGPDEPRPGQKRWCFNTNEPASVESRGLTRITSVTLHGAAKVHLEASGQPAGLLSLRARGPLVGEQLSLKGVLGATGRSEAGWASEKHSPRGPANWRSDHRACGKLISWCHVPQVQTGRQVTLFPPQLKALTGLRALRKKRVGTWLVDYFYENTFLCLHPKSKVCALH